MVKWMAPPAPRCLGEGAGPQLPPADRRPELLLSKEEVPCPFPLGWSTDSQVGIKLPVQGQQVKEKEVNYY